MVDRPTVDGGPSPDIQPGGNFAIDARNVDEPLAFFCAIGEAINGPGGYFGADLDGLADCLRGGFGVLPPFTLEWVGGVESFGQEHSEFVAEVKEIFERAQVSVSGPWCG
ncbi:barstar family protein [Nocardia callitridis]|uniref:Barstar (barnase inhibitor) domain-containing protein n=1 Tax=Nocardia callitridis TaxID=648753 RepID=A0ABP9L0H8_9NOCA